MKRLESKCGIVTGGAVGFGRACVQRMAEECSKVAISKLLEYKGRELRGNAPELEAAKAAAGALHPLGHMGEPDDVAWAIVYLASDEAKSVTGAELATDGGYTAR